MLAAWRRLYRRWRRHSRSCSRFQKQTRKAPKKRWGWTLSATPALSSLFFLDALASLSSSPSWNTSPRLLPFYPMATLFFFFYPKPKRVYVDFSCFLINGSETFFNFFNVMIMKTEKNLNTKYIFFLLGLWL